MKPIRHPSRPPRGPAALVVAAGAALLAGCGASTPGTNSVSDAEWQALAVPRPTPLPGAVRLALAQVELLGEPAWPAEAGVPASLGVAELIAAGLLRRADVHYVERRRFSAAVEAERAGRRPRGAPPAGVSPGAEISASVVWVPLGAGGGSLEVRLTDVASGRVVQTQRSLIPSDVEPVGVARAAVGTILRALGTVGRRPAWSDPLAGTAPDEYVASGVPSRALASFATGIGAEERWRWEAARAAYQAAAASGGFFEAEAALARTARLRLGGTLGES